MKNHEAWKRLAKQFRGRSGVQIMLVGRCKCKWLFCLQLLWSDKTLSSSVKKPLNILLPTGTAPFFLVLQVVLECNLVIRYFYWSSMKLWVLKRHLNCVTWLPSYISLQITAWIILMFGTQFSHINNQSATDNLNKDVHQKRYNKNFHCSLKTQLKLCLFYGVCKSRVTLRAVCRWPRVKESKINWQYRCAVTASPLPRCPIQPFSLDSPHHLLLYVFQGWILFLSKSEWLQIQIMSLVHIASRATSCQWCLSLKLTKW